MTCSECYRVKTEHIENMKAIREIIAEYKSKIKSYGLEVWNAAIEWKALNESSRLHSKTQEGFEEWFKKYRQRGAAEG